MNDSGLRVLVVEVSALLAERLNETIGQIAGLEVVGTTDTEQGALDILRTTNVDVMILELQLREGTGFGILKQLHGQKPRTIVLSNFGLPAYQQRARELGVEHFLDKSREFERLPEILQQISSGAH